MNSNVANNYHNGCEVTNYQGYGLSELDNCMPFPFDTVSSDVDKRIEKPKNVKGFNRFVGCSKMACLANGWSVYKLSNADSKKVVANIKSHFEDVAACIGYLSKQLCFETTCDTQSCNGFVVKVFPAPTIRMMLTGVREVFIMNDIYNSRYHHLRGCDIAPLPLLGCPIWNGKKWCYVIIMERVKGVPISRASILSSKVFNYNDKMHEALNDTLKTFWILGYAHNDLRGANVIYDTKTHTAKIIDFECAVRLPQDVVTTFRKCLFSEQCSNISDLFESVYKKPAVSLLYLVSKYCDQYADEDNFIFNTDDYLLRLVEIL